MVLQFYGKKSCITCQKAKAFLEEQGIVLEEFAIETHPPDEKLLKQLLREKGVKACLNSRSAMYKARQLGKHVPDEATALALMQEEPNLIKRPVLVNAHQAVYQGFDPDSLPAFLQ